MTSRMKNNLIISTSPLDRAPRVYTQILHLKEAGRFRITSAGPVPSSIEDRFYRIAGLAPRMKDPILISGAFRLMSERLDPVIANGFPSLLAALRIA